jgi:hypothetical protein
VRFLSEKIVRLGTEDEGLLVVAFIPAVRHSKAPQASLNYKTSRGNMKCIHNLHYCDLTVYL